MPDILAEKLVAYMQAKGFVIDRDPGQVNIVYLEGSNPDGSENPDAADGWNDRRIVLMFEVDGAPYLALNVAATTEPGTSATFDTQSKRNGGAFRIDFGQHLAAWRMGFHKSNRTHPALCQAVDCIPGRRDKNQDQKRTGDPKGCGRGVNQHGTTAGFRSPRVGNWSRGCMVGQYWADHLAFIEICRRDPRFVNDKGFLFSTTIIAGDDFARFRPV